MVQATDSQRSRLLVHRIELLALVLGAASMGGMIWLLAYYDDKPIFEWHHVTLDAEVSVLSAIVRGILLISVGSCLSQFRWIWFNEKPQPLPDFEIISNAAHGPVGSLRLLWRTRLTL